MTDTRSFEHEIEIPARPEAVWKAIANAEELVRWFPFDADVELRPGGAYRISWGGLWQWDMEVRLFDPPRRLVLLDRRPTDHDAEGRPVKRARPAPVEISLEFQLEAGQGGTRLRLVHSGFGRGSEWDDEFDGISHGWRQELRGLRHYLEHHAGRARAVAWARRVSKGTADEVWRRLSGSAGLCASGTLEGLAIGERFEIRSSDGDVLAGEVYESRPPREFLARAANHGDGLFRIWLDRVGPEHSVNVWLSAWGIDPAPVKRLEQRWSALLARQLG